MPATSAWSIGDMPAEERPNLLPVVLAPDYNDAWNQLWPQVSCEAWQAGNGGHYCNPRVEALLEQARTAVDEAAYQSALGEIQQIVTRDDPAAIYFAQPEWLTVLRRDVVGFAPNLVVGDLVDFYALRARTTGARRQPCQRSRLVLATWPGLGPQRCPSAPRSRPRRRRS